MRNSLPIIVSLLLFIPPATAPAQDLEARALKDPDARKEIYSEVISILQEDLPIVYLYHSKWIFAMDSDVQGFKAYPDGIIRLTGVTAE